jgi:alkylation response protein AidB-like acyl-CoA dehydrogenase
MAAAAHARIVNRRDLDFLLFEWLGLEELLERPVFADHSRETLSAMLDLGERLATERFLPHYKTSDQKEPRLVGETVQVLPEIRDALREAADAGLFAASFSQDVGGLRLPQAVFSACEGLLMSANIATAAYLMLTVANARLIAAFGTPAQIEAFARPQIEGRMLGTMCLSEPQAGSSLADIGTRAIPDRGDALGQVYRLFGNKMWISGGDHDVTGNIVHLVLAKVPGPDGKLIEGSKGISLFIVPKRLPHPSGGDAAPNDIAVAGLNHKMGYRGIPNCLLNFGEGRHRPGGAAGAVGFLVGEVGQGLPIMFQMMNEARIAVGLGAAMLGYRGYLHALHYARERRQGRPPGARGGARAGGPVAIIEHPDVKRMLLAQKAYAEGALALVLYCARFVDDQHTSADPQVRASAAATLGLLTPIAKTWPSEWCLAGNDLAIQIHGGYGYTRDFDVEQLYRDNRLNAIHEGTTGIQALDLLGRKILRDRGEGLGRLRAQIAATALRAREWPGLGEHAASLDEAWERLVRAADDLIALDDEPRALANATPFLRAFGHGVLAWIWLDKACLCRRALEDGRAPASYYAGKLRACRYFFECELPKIEAWLGAVLGDVAADASVDEF